jgi:hypothetical protein
VNYVPALSSTRKFRLPSPEQPIFHAMLRWSRFTRPFTGRLPPEQGWSRSLQCRAGDRAGAAPGRTNFRGDKRDRSQPSVAPTAEAEQGLAEAAVKQHTATT